MGQLASQCDTGPLVPRQCKSCSSLSSKERTLDFDFLENEHDVGGGPSEVNVNASAMSSQMHDPSAHDPQEEQPPPNHRDLQAFENRLPPSRFVEVVPGHHIDIPGTMTTSGRPRRTHWNPMFYCVAALLAALLCALCLDIAQRMNPDRDLFGWLKFETSTATTTTMTTTTTSTGTTTTVFGSNNPALGSAIAVSSATPIPLAVGFNLQHIPYEALLSNPKVTSAVVMEMQHTIAEVVGNGVTPSQITITLRNSSFWNHPVKSLTIVDATIRDVPATTAGHIVENVNVTMLSTMIAASLESVQGITDVSTGKIVASDMSSMHIPSADVETQKGLLAQIFAAKAYLLWIVMGVTLVICVLSVAGTLLFYQNRRRRGAPGYRTLAKQGAASAKRDAAPAGGSSPKANAIFSSAEPSVQAAHAPSPSVVTPVTRPVTSATPKEMTAQERQRAEEVEQLCGMGFSEEQARSALERADGDVEKAATALLSGGADEQVVEAAPPTSEQGPPPNTPAAAEEHVDAEEAEKLEQLTGMGFSDQQAKIALREAGGNSEVALEKLLASQ